jgi:hypothetical protein
MPTHTGGCHCGKVRYRVETDFASVMQCNCTICSKHGLVLTFVPGAQFTLESGADDVQAYLFNKMHIHHQFCKTCGVESFARGNMRDGSPMVAVNVRCLDGIDLQALTIAPFDGKSL